LNELELTHELNSFELTRPQHCLSQFVGLIDVDRFYMHIDKRKKH